MKNPGSERHKTHIYPENDKEIDKKVFFGVFFRSDRSTSRIYRSFLINYKKMLPFTFVQHIICYENEI